MLSADGHLLCKLAPQKPRRQDYLARLVCAKAVDAEGWLSEIPLLIRKYYDSFGDHMPKELYDKLKILGKSLTATDKEERANHLRNPK